MTVKEKSVIVSTTIRAHLYLAFATLIYGANYSIAKVVMDDNYLQPLGFILLRVITATTLFWFFHFTFVRERIDRRDLLHFLGCAVFGVAINQMCFFAGLKHTTPINASLIMTTTPILVLLFSMIILKEHLTPTKLFGIALGAAGAILLITYGQDLSFNRQRLRGDLLVLVNSTSYGLYLVLVKNLMKKYHPITVVKWVFTLGFFLVLPFGLEQLQAAPWHTFLPGIWLAVAYVLIFTTFLAFLLNAFALTAVSPSVVSIYIYLQPLFATLIALAWGKDQLTGMKVLAGMLIFTGVYLVSFGSKKIPKPVEQVS